MPTLPTVIYKNFVACLWKRIKGIKLFGYFLIEHRSQADWQGLAAEGNVR